MEQRSEIRNIKAEVLLNYLYPELAGSWRVENRGTFYRNYSEDLLSFDPDSKVIELSRDGIMRLLPPRMVSNTLLRDEVVESSHKESEALRLLSELFVPFDTLLFRLNMQIEGVVSQLIVDYEEYVLREYFGYDLRTIENRYLKMLLPLLPYIAKLKVDYHAISSMVSRITGHDVEFAMGCYSKSHRAEVVLGMVRFMIYVDGLDSDSLIALNEELTPFFEVIKEWFIPFDQMSEFRICERGANVSKVSQDAILSYNTVVGR